MVATAGLVGNGLDNQGCESPSVSCERRRIRYLRYILMAAFRLSRQLTLSQGDGLSQSKKNCFCLGFTDDPSTLFMRLGCNCVIHYHCLVQYLQHRIGDRRNMNLLGISCPYGGECKSLSGSDDSGGVYYVTLDDLDNIVEYGVSHPDLK